ncbi:UbiD family decarboxylase domain-containing protein [Burkholderia cenocepacia]|uniref:UbiD family decarboxylase domain-containing protein n=1 Tax=Burkholderia cenocepacia TaxID=95486 RepID=UPI00201308CA|nr:UbiD family decarboxylase domain-containing protein [Burkholderia cenocepacia]
MRHYLSRLRSRGELLTVKREVDPRYEIAAVARRLQDETTKPVLFTNVRGSCKRLGATSSIFARAWGMM